MTRDVRRDAELANRIQDPFLRRTVKTALHLRRYFPFYVFGTLMVVLVSIFPTIQNRGTSKTAGRTSVSSGSQTNDTAAPVAQAAAGAGGSGGGAVAGASRPAAVATAAPSRSAQQSAAIAHNQSGVTRGGVACKPGVRQLTFSEYAPPCVAAFGGDNGGSSSFGVSGNEIVIVRRGFPDSANSNAINQVVKQAGGADPADVSKIRDVFIPYFDKAFELYGRHVKWVDYDSKYGNSTDEALSRGREGACADATYIKTNLHAFAVVGGRNTVGVVSAVFAQCAAERGMMTFGAGPYYPENWYRSLHPYAWGGVMECERIAYQLAEYLGKRLINRKARWAGDPTGLTQQQTRKFGTYIPDNDQYLRCGKISTETLRTKYHYEAKTEEYHYALDVSRFPDQAAQAIVQFKAAGVTTIILADDPISNIFLTQSAAKQSYFPEWVQIGTALNDVDNAARLWDQTEVNGHLFGMSQLGAAEKLFGKKSEPWLLYKQLTGEDMSKYGATDGTYWGTMGLYAALQLAGPYLTPDAIATGLFTAPPGGAPDFAVGYTSFADGPDGTPGAHSHTAIDDTREIYWMGNQNSPSDGQKGTYVETYGGKRFRNNEWPAEEPPIYPNGTNPV